ncbi:(deoxy)nucleoside triphosphate pyrophosphohydrolase [Bacillus sp. AFS055030]|uniref:(deoxy)nucleoside triphosphate pyrophosphohydrolase n=1 Tax=Bacillus sp. AFS055030 TaxID=2033507 RepID=UPI000BFC9BF1|nr:(deoxy)nucleoside triphosphate pyrophosphohydrolase [Bacillus sp. AFS055030]PGL70200.1 8-oxo-dGTP diphosphatase MutT [Bacillus sp. AFS055030]
MKKQIKVVGAVIRNDQNQILCALRSPEMSMPNCWEFPGGKIEKNEKPEEALIREIMEELGCEIAVYVLVEDVIHEYPNIIVNLITYEAKIISGTPIANEHTKIEWKDISDLTKLEWAPADIPTVEKLVSLMSNNC